MKEKLYTIPLMDALRAGDECPFCYIERSLEQHALDFVLGPECTHMQGDVREATDQAGFCREHLFKMFEYGNRLGSAQILETHMQALMTELEKEMKRYRVLDKPNLLDRVCKNDASTENGNSVSKWIHEKTETCYICDHIQNNYKRYMETFFFLYKKNDPEFMALVEGGKGFCLKHFAQLLERSTLYLSAKDQEKLKNMLFTQMQENLHRVHEDVKWFICKNDYRYIKEDWKTSRDAVQRAIQKLAGGYPADPPYQSR